MKRNATITAWSAVFLLLSATAEAVVTRQVTTTQDQGSWSLREALLMACSTPGDDEIRFHPMVSSEIRIFPLTPLEIPGDCNGTVTLIGTSDEGQQEVILDGGELAPGSEILSVKSWGNRIQGLTFVGNTNGAGVVLEGDDNVIEGNYFGVYRDKSKAGQKKPNLTGIDVTGDWNVVEDNVISANTRDGIFIEGDANSVWGNKIGSLDGDCPKITLPPLTTHDFSTFVHEIFHGLLLKAIPLKPVISDVCGNGAAGIYVTGDKNLIGSSLSDDANEISFNKGAGIVVDGGYQNIYMKNVIAFNEGKGIELKNGGNNETKALRSLKAFPEKTTPKDGNFTLFGHGEKDMTVDLYQVAEGETDVEGEGAKFISSVSSQDGFFTYTLKGLPPGSGVSAIVCDRRDNCSEFSRNAVLGEDSDQDGILDPVEDPNEDQIVDVGEMDPFLIDTDGDNLPDSIEDKNEDGKIDTSETDPKKADTDGDGISDWIETGGDGKYDKDKGDTDPLKVDTDGDGKKDGYEDKDRDGVIELGETDPGDPLSF